jgi:hypothetical protein
VKVLDEVVDLLAAMLRSLHEYPFVPVKTSDQGR